MAQPSRRLPLVKMAAFSLVPQTATPAFSLPIDSEAARARPGGVELL